MISGRSSARRFRNGSGRAVFCPFEDGKVVECDPLSDFACCSALGWCGNTKAHCHCKGCVNYKEPLRVAPVVDKEPFKEPVAVSGGVARAEKGATVVLIIPFRDRESHLKLFKRPGASGRPA